jgi:ligand-binding sensor domain-containing protein
VILKVESDGLPRYSQWMVGNCMITLRQRAARALHVANQILLFCVVHGSYAIAAEARPVQIASTSQVQVRDLNFTHLTTKDGLSQSNVTAILQDRRGFMWFATRDGLNR